MRKLLFLLVCALGWTSFTLLPEGKDLPKLEVSANKHYLTAGGKPFFWLGDTGWLLLSKLNRQETEKYLEDRRQKGFNVIQIMVLHSLNAVTVEGDSALIHRNPAFPHVKVLGPDDATPRISYWDNLDYVADLAASKGLYLALVPVWGSNVKSGLVNRKQAADYARFLALQYKNKTNIIWMNGGDIRGDDSIQVWKTIGNTLKKMSPNQLVTFHPFGRTQSSRWFQNEPWLDFNMFQSGHRDYAQDTSKIDMKYGEDNWRYVQSDYKKTPTKPTLDGEPSYEGIPHGLHDTLQPKWTDNDLRRYAYWSVFSGACGFTYGNSSVMQMYKGGSKAGAYGARQTWEEAIKAPGAGQMIHLKDLMLKYNFQELVPDQSLLTLPGNRYDHLVALKGNNILLVYTYNGRTFSLKKDLLKGENFKLTWYSPRDGSYSRSLEIKKADLKDLDPPGEQKNGNDWVLILETI
ncbi:MAG: glycoside hydrolase family 140 protein [Prolixibacteraceae bacterium]